MSLKRCLFEAFAARPRPRPEAIVRPAVSREGDRLRQFLATKTPGELSADDLRTEVEGNLWMLSPDAFRYFLPAFLSIALEWYAAASVFASELVGALTEPSRDDVAEAFDRLAGISPGIGLPANMTDRLREEQLEWFDSGGPAAIFRERVDGLTPAEGAAVLAFFEALRESHAADFPFEELPRAIDRHWSRYRTSGRGTNG